MTDLSSLPAFPMNSVAVFKAVLLSLFVACFGSFTWGMSRFFRASGPVPLAVRFIQTFGAALIILHGMLLLRARALPGWQEVVACIGYLVSLSVFWAAVHANRIKPLSFCFYVNAPAHLVTTGPYRWIRHPFYTAYILAWVSGVFATRQVWLAGPAVVMCALYLSAAMTEERNFLTSSLASEFRKYKQKTGMFFPRFI